MVPSSGLIANCAADITKSLFDEATASPDAHEIATPSTLSAFNCRTASFKLATNCCCAFGS